MRTKNYRRRGMSILALIAAAALPLGCVLAYYLYSLGAWFRIDPIPGPADASEPLRLATIDRWLDLLFKQHKFNGGVLLVRDGQPLLSKTYGFTDHTATQRLNEHSAFQLASLSKQFTAAGILRLAELGKLSLNDPIAKHLGGFTSDEFMGEKVTIRHLLNHTSGIPDVYMELAEEHRSELGDVLTTSEVVELIKQHAEFEGEPGDATQYSNTGYVLLAAVAEAASGKSFEQFMHDELFQPLGMNDTRVWNLLSADRSPNQAGEFDQLDDDRTPLENPWLDGVAGDGAVYCSLHDFVIWDRLWNDNPLIGEELLREAFNRPKLNDGSESNYAFGWVVEPHRHWHNGSWLGANTYIVRYPETKYCLVVLDNSSNIRLETIAGQIEEALKPVLEPGK